MVPWNSQPSRKKMPCYFFAMCKILHHFLQEPFFHMVPYKKGFPLHIFLFFLRYIHFCAIVSFFYQDYLCLILHYSIVSAFLQVLKIVISSGAKFEIFQIKDFTIWTSTDSYLYSMYEIEPSTSARVLGRVWYRHGHRGTALIYLVFTTVYLAPLELSQAHFCEAASVALDTYHVVFQCFKLS